LFHKIHDHVRNSPLDLSHIVHDAT